MTVDSVGVGNKADIATLSITERELEEIAKHPISSWPPAPPDDDDRGVLLAGCPATEIALEGPRTEPFRHLCLLCGCAANHSMATFVQSRMGLRTGNSRIGKIASAGLRHGRHKSGGPVLTIREHNGILSFPLAGGYFRGAARVGHHYCRSRGFHTERTVQSELKRLSIRSYPNITSFNAARTIVRAGDLANCAERFAVSALHKLAKLAKAFTIGRWLRSLAPTAALRGDDPHHVAVAEG